jgi:hypothetical protein
MANGNAILNGEGEILLLCLQFIAFKKETIRFNKTNLAFELAYHRSVGGFTGLHSHFLNLNITLEYLLKYTF